MTWTSEVIYASSNGDRWLLLTDPTSGRTLVRHEAAPSSGGNASEVSVPVFLSTNGSGPEFQALRARLALTAVDPPDDAVSAHDLEAVSVAVRLTNLQIGLVDAFQRIEKLATREAAVELLVEIALDVVNGSGRRFWDRSPKPTGAA